MRARGSGGRSGRALERSDPAEVVRAGEADQSIRRGEAALVSVQEGEAELRQREQRDLIERLPLYVSRSLTPTLWSIISSARRSPSIRITRGDTPAA